MIYFHLLLFWIVMEMKMLQAATVFEGDLVMDTKLGNVSARKNFYRNVILNERKLWPQGIIPYIISPNFKLHFQTNIGLAMRRIEKSSCIRLT